MATERPGSPSPAQLGPSVWPSTQYTTASRRPREAISQTAAPQRSHMGAAVPGDDHGSAPQRPRARIPKDTAGWGQADRSDRSRAEEGLGAIGWHQQLFVCLCPTKKYLYVHNGVGAATGAAVFSRMCSRNQGQLATASLKEADNSPCYPSENDQEGHGPRASQGWHRQERG